jgi:hypothetical protein
MKLWVKIPDKPTGKVMVTCLDSLKAQLHNAGLDKPVIGVRLNRETKALEIEVEE